MIKIKNVIVFIIIFSVLNCSKEDKKIKINSILLFGDSLMSGYGLLEEEHLSKILEKDLKLDGYSINVLNESISGDTTFDGLNRVESIFLDKNYDLVIIGLGANDMLKGINPKVTKKNLEKIIEIILKKNTKILLTGMVASPARGLEYKKKFDQVFPDLKNKYDLNFMPFLLKGVALRPKYNQSDLIHPNTQGIQLISNNLKEIIIDLM